MRQTRILLLTGALAALLGLPAPAYGGYTVSRPVGSVVGHWLDHTYTATDEWGCWENFGGECSCTGDDACRWWQRAPLPAACPGSWFHRWTYGVHGVCHQATNNEAYHMGAVDGIVSAQVRGMGISTGMFGYWGTDGGC